jgi:hypothetical protein
MESVSTALVRSTGAVWARSRFQPLPNGNPHNRPRIGHPPFSYPPLHGGMGHQPRSGGRDRRASTAATGRRIVPSIPESLLGRARGCFAEAVSLGTDEPTPRDGVPQEALNGSSWLCPPQPESLRPQRERPPETRYVSALKSKHGFRQHRNPDDYRVRALQAAPLPSPSGVAAPLGSTIWV